MLFNVYWSLALLCVTIGIYNLGMKGRKKSFIKYIEDHLMKTVICITICGLLFYCWGYWEDYEGEKYEYNNSGNLIVIISKALVSALGMFVSTSDIVDLKSELRHNVFFMTPFILVHLSAVFISIMVILRVLGYKFSSFIKMHFQSPSKKTYIFWGINENSLMLAESIRDKEKENATFVFVELPSIDKYDYNPLVGLFNKHSIQRSYISRMESIDAYLVKTQYALKDINEYDFKEKSSNNIYVVLGLRTLNRFLQKTCKLSKSRTANEGGRKNIFNETFYVLNKILGSLKLKLSKLIKSESTNTEAEVTTQISFYILSDSEIDNMNDLMDIIKLYGGANNIPLHKIYCHARNNSTNSIISRGTEKICFADSSNLSVLQLLKQTEYHPVNFVDFNTSNAIVTSEFNALLVGFGETGRDAFNFLYEFSSFLGQDGNLAPRTINVVDSKLSELTPKFLNNCPALKGKNDINWWGDMSINSKNFWDQFIVLMNKLNYIVITLNDDKIASDLAVKMYQMAYRYRNNMNHFKIFVRLKDTDSAELLNQITKYYKDNSNRDDKGYNTLISFGTYRTLFNIDILSDIDDKDSMAFSDQYYKIYEDINSGLPEEDSAPKPTLLAKDIKSLTNKQQDVSNVRHVDTKLVLAGAIKVGKDDKIHYDSKRVGELKIMSEREGVEYKNALDGTDNFTLMENLSLCEHLRWNSKLEVLGFVQSKMNPNVKYIERDYDCKTHECLVTCHELNTIPKFKNVKIFDWAVVELSIRYKLQKIQEGNMNKKTYTPTPIDTSDIQLPEELTPLIEAMAKNVHDVWAQSRISQGWQYGEQRDDTLRHHPCLVAYEDLPEEEKAYDRDTAVSTLKLICKLGFSIKK